MSKKNIQKSIYFKENVYSLLGIIHNKRKV